mmetsp:Transcript_40627/g.65310  ORF Transcript_40627/g.65310 Transcript_40627/m.65310 type:complete len:87 (-) Transcript_40627:639-899(-)
MWRNSIQRSRNLLLLRCELIQSRCIIQMDPGKPLLSVAKRTASEKHTPYFIESKSPDENVKCFCKSYKIESANIPTPRRRGNFMFA